MIMISPTGYNEDPEQARSKEMSLGQHESMMVSPTHEKDEKGEDYKKRGMRKYYIVCAVVLLVVIAVIAYVVPTYVVDSDDGK
eukprot:scaffold2747_cov104-Cylindrotheca_fusiformis.AAC.8